MTHFLFVDAHVFFEEHGPSAQSVLPSSLSVDPGPISSLPVQQEAKGDSVVLK